MTRTLKDKVLYILREIPETRNDDVLLTTEVWKRYFPQYIHTSMHPQRGELTFVELRAIFLLPREDHVKRIRAAIQNDPVSRQYLPTRESVARQRKMNIETWRQFLGYETSRDTL